MLKFQVNLFLQERIISIQIYQKVIKFLSMNLPIVFDGKLEIIVNGENKIIGITRAHLEEDAGKSIHDLYDIEIIMI